MADTPKRKTERTLPLGELPPWPEKGEVPRQGDSREETNPEAFADLREALTALYISMLTPAQCGVLDKIRATGMDFEAVRAALKRVGAPVSMILPWQAYWESKVQAESLPEEGTP